MTAFLRAVGRFYLDLLFLPVRLIRNEWASLQAVLAELDVTDDPFDCQVCEGEGFVAVNFDVHSNRRPALMSCPACEP